jgi:hypothetical protein
MARPSAALLLALGALLLAAAAAPRAGAQVIATDSEDFAGPALSSDPDQQIYYMTTADPVAVDDAAPQVLESAVQDDLPAPVESPPADAERPVPLMRPTSMTARGGSADCPDGSSFFKCFADPCKAASCPAGTVCSSDYCEWRRGGAGGRGGRPAARGQAAAQGAGELPEARSRRARNCPDAAPPASRCDRAGPLLGPAPTQPPSPCTPALTLPAPILYPAPSPHPPQAAAATLCASRRLRAGS